VNVLATWGPWGLAVFIFAARIVDVTLGTLRIIFVARGNRVLAPLFGFVEVIIWLVAIGQVVQNLSHPLAYVAWAGGFAVGTWVGISIENRMAVGLLAVHVITREDATDLMEALNTSQYGVTSMGARGIAGRVRLLLTVIHRQDLRAVTEIVRRLHPGAFISVGDVRAAREGIFRPAPSLGHRLWNLVRKGR
jgi:uncharacterized protein YebE (UPF0316 family)